MAQMNQIIENTMVSGYSVPPEQEDRPDYLCPRCGLEMSLKASVYEWNDLWLCNECFADAIFSLSPDDREEMSSEDGPTTEKIIIISNPDELASLFDARVKKAEEVA